MNIELEILKKINTELIIMNKLKCIELKENYDDF